MRKPSSLARLANIGLAVLAINEGAGLLVAAGLFSTGAVRSGSRLVSRAIITPLEGPLTTLAAACVKGGYCGRH